MPVRSHSNSILLPAVASLLVALGVSFDARADEVVAPATPPAQPAAPAPASASPAVEKKTAEKKPAPWRGSVIYYGHGITALTLDKAAEPLYNPTYSHHLDLWGEWHFSDHVFSRMLFSLGQEFTQSDDTTRDREIVASDLSLETGINDIALPVGGIKLASTARLTLPTSKASLAQTRLFTLGPTLALSRKFALMQGLLLVYYGRFDFRFHRYTTAETDAPELVACGLSKVDICQDYFNTGTRNAWGALVHGPRVIFSPTERLTFIGYYQFVDQFLYAPAKAEPSQLPETVTASSVGDPGARYANSFGLIASYELTKVLGLSLGTSTYSAQLAPDGTYRQPFFNRNTTLSLDVVIDIDAFIAAF